MEVCSNKQLCSSSTFSEVNFGKKIDEENLDVELVDFTNRTFYYVEVKDLFSDALVVHNCSQPKQQHCLSRNTPI